MANPPRLQVSGLPAMTSEQASATVSPARGAEMRNFLQQRLNRAPPLVHSWEFWHDRQERSPAGANSATYEQRLKLLAQISDVKQFWEVLNNFSIEALSLRDSIHLFHKGVKPVWEDPRNSRGGSWTFRVPKSQAADFWREVCCMAIGEQLQAAVEEPGRNTFRDDICGLSLSVRFNSMLIQIWNRDGGHDAGIERIFKSVKDGMAEELVPKEGNYYYKRHSEHSGFNKVTAQEAQTAASNTAAHATSDVGGIQSLDAVVRGS